MSMKNRRWKLSAEPKKRHPECKCTQVPFGFSTIIMCKDAPKGGLPGNHCNCGRTWMDLGAKKTWHLITK
jgi:hypothetical protein